MGIFSFLKSKPKLPPLSGLEQIGVDMHSHLIPGVDDGSQSIEESVSLIEGLHKLGYNELYTTPHAMADGYRNAADTILPGLENVQNALKEKGVPVKLYAAAEYFFDENFLNLLEKKELLTLGDNYVLFELSYINKPGSLNDVVFKIQEQGYKPILAHPERYPYFGGKGVADFRDLRSRGVNLQVNINSLSSRSKGTLEMAKNLIEEGMVDFLGTDLHNHTHLEEIQKNLSHPYLRMALEKNNIKNQYLRRE